MGAPLVVGALVIGGLLVAAYRARKRAHGPGATAAEGVPAPNFAGPLGAELRHAKDEGWDVLFTKAERAHGLPPGILAAVASRETNTVDKVGDYGHGRGLMQIDDRSHGLWLREHGVPGFVAAVTHAEKDENGKLTGKTIIDKPGDGGKPNVADAIDRAGGLIKSGLAAGRAHGVAEGDLLKFALSAYNAGESGASSGFKLHGDSDYNTTGKDYGHDVLRRWREMFPAEASRAPALSSPRQEA